VLKMVSSSTGFLKGMMEISLAGAACNMTSSHVGTVNDGSTLSPDTDDNDATPPSQPANGPSLPQPSAAGGDNKTTSRRFGKGLAWLHRRCRRPGGTPSSGEHAGRYWWRRRSATTNACPTTPPEGIHPSDDVIDKKRGQTSRVRGNNKDRQDSAVGGVYEKRAKWLKRCGRIADSDDYRADVVDDESVTAVSGFSGHSLSSTEKLDVAISVISDGLSPSKVTHCFAAGEPGSTDRDARLNDRDGGMEAEVVLDPAALSTTQHVADDQSRAHLTPTAVDHIPPAKNAYVPAWQPGKLVIEDNTHDVVSRRKSPTSLCLSGSSTTDHTEHREPPPLSSEVDFLCNEIGSLVADYMRQHLVLVCDLSIKIYANYTPIHDRLINKIMISHCRTLSFQWHKCVCIRYL